MDVSSSIASPYGLVGFLKRRMMALVLCGMGLTVIGLTGAEYARYRTDVASLRQKLMDAKRNTIRAQVQYAMEFIEFFRRSGETRLRRRLQTRIDEAWNLMSRLYERNRDASHDEICRILHDAVHGLRWDDGKGYYFIVGLDAVVRVHPLFPELEGVDTWDMHDDHGTHMFQDCIGIAKKKNAGFSEYCWRKTAEASSDTPKVTYVRLFEPLGWVIGTGEYRDDADATLQKEVKQRLSAISFGNDEGYIFVRSYDGVELVNRNQPSLVGQNRWEVTNPDGVKVIQELVRSARQPNENFVTYAWNRPTLGSPVKKLSFARSLPEWRWIVGTGLYLDDVDRAVADARSVLLSTMAEKLGLILLATAALGGTIGCYGRRVSRQLADEIDQFANDFTEAVDTGNPMVEGRSCFQEFQHLGSSVNTVLSALQEREAFKRALLDGIEVGVVVIDPRDHRIVEVNPATATMVGCSQNDILGRYCHDVICLVQEGQCPVTDLHECLDGCERVLIRADGGQIPVIKTIKRVMLGEQEWLLESLVDISDRKRMEAERARTLEEAERLNQLMLGREERVLELKQEINDLRVELGTGVKYESVVSNGVV
jgi:PAS domain S-box-containing protein